MSLVEMFEHKLLLLSEDFPPSVGGLQAYVSGLWGALPPDRSFVVAGSEPGDHAWDAQRKYRVVRVNTRALTYPRWRPAWHAARALVRRQNIEAVVCGKALFEGRAALRLKEEFGLPYVVLTYALEVLTWLSSPRTRAQLLEVLTGAGRILVINEPVRQALLASGVPEPKLVKLYPGVAEEFFRAPGHGDEFRERLGLQGKRVVTAVGRLIPRKGFDVLLRGFASVIAEVPEAHLVVVGDGPERERLEALTRDLGIERGVTLAGSLPPGDVRRTLAISELFALTPVTIEKDMEGFGIVYVEAAALGVPALASRSGGVPEAVLDSETGLLVPERDHGATGRALAQLLQDNVLRARLAGNARARAEKEFHWKGRALLFQGMVHSLLSEQRV